MSLEVPSHLVVLCFGRPADRARLIAHLLRELPQAVERSARAGRDRAAAVAMDAPDDRVELEGRARRLPAVVDPEQRARLGLQVLKLLQLQGEHVGYGLRRGHARLLVDRPEGVAPPLFDLVFLEPRDEVPGQEGDHQVAA